MDPTFLAIWLAMSSAFHAGALHVQQGDYAAAVMELNQVITAPAPAVVMDWQARLLRGEALYMLDRREEGLIDLMAVAQSPEEPFANEAAALLTRFHATDRERLLPHQVVDAFNRACREGDQAAALAHCLAAPASARAQLLELWDDEAFQTAMAATEDGQTKAHGDREQYPYARYFKHPTMPDMTVYLGFDGGWYIRDLIVGLPGSGGSFNQSDKSYHLMQISTCIMEYRRAHDGRYSPAFTKELLPHVYDHIFTEFSAFHPARPNRSLYLPPPDGLDKAALATWILYAHDANYSGFYRQVVYANGHIGMLSQVDYLPRIAAQRALLPPDGPANTVAKPPTGCTLGSTHRERRGGNRP